MNSKFISKKKKHDIDWSRIHSPSLFVITHQRSGSFYIPHLKKSGDLKVKNSLDQFWSGTSSLKISLKLSDWERRDGNVMEDLDNNSDVYQGGRYHSGKSLCDIFPVFFLELWPQNNGVVDNKLRQWWLHSFVVDDTFAPSVVQY